MNYISTRGGEAVSSSLAVLRGIAPDGGLYVPETFPEIYKKLYDLEGLKYQELALEVLSVFLTDFPVERLKEGIHLAYSEAFKGDVAPLVRVGDDYFLELFHGRTSAFKDVALSILPYLTTTAAEINNLKEKTVILTATSGDTGKAALAAFANVPGTYIIVFFPENGVSYVQKKQMQTQEGDNALVVGIDGNFDQAQTGVKAIFNDLELSANLKKSGYVLSSANSINIGRLLPQVVYYYYAYGQMVKAGEISMGEKLDFTVPTGNFGNILAGYYAKKTGLPIGRLLCASNENKVLYDFFSTGVYDRNRGFHLTASPSMDILVSSNLERFLYHLCGDARKIKELMNGLSTEGRFMFELAEHDIVGGFANDDEARAAIREVYGKGYIIDTHTAVAYAAYEKIGGSCKNVVLATASPYKFAGDVCGSIDRTAPEEPFAAIDRLNELAAAVGAAEAPKSILELKEKPVLHERVCECGNMAAEVLGFLNDRTISIGL